jgi:hypothetical protein
MVRKERVCLTPTVDWRQPIKRGKQEVVAQWAGRKEASRTSRIPATTPLVFVRKIVGKAVKNIFVVKAVWLSDNGGGLPRVNDISAIADLNGDGVMEVVVNNAYYKGSGSDVIEFIGARSRDVLSFGCDH